MKFRPCIDLYNGTVKQIIGSTFKDNKDPKINYSSGLSPEWFAKKYRESNLFGGHIIKLGKGNDIAAKKALDAWPNGFQIGGDININNAQKWLDCGASSIIVTSWIFTDDQVDIDKIKQLSKCIGKDKIVIDLSCKIFEEEYYVVKDRWQTPTKLKINFQNLDLLSKYCTEFLIHAVDVEGMKSGIDKKLINKLSNECPIPCVYAGGINTIKDLENIAKLGKNTIDVTIGSALDIFGGKLLFDEVVKFCDKNISKK